MWFDVEKRVQIGVAATRPPDAMTLQPLAVRSDASGGKPWLELVVDRAGYGPQGTITGRVIVNNPGGKNIRKVDLSLDFLLRKEARGYVDEPRTAVFRQELPWAGTRQEAPPIPFAHPFQVGQPQCPSFVGQHCAARWILAANLDIAWGFDVATSIEVQLAGVQPPA